MLLPNSTWLRPRMEDLPINPLNPRPPRLPTPNLPPLALLVLQRLLAVQQQSRMVLQQPPSVVLQPLLLAAVQQMLQQLALLRTVGRLAPLQIALKPTPRWWYRILLEHQVSHCHNCRAQNKPSKRDNVGQWCSIPVTSIKLLNSHPPPLTANL